MKKRKYNNFNGLLLHNRRREIFLLLPSDNPFPADEGGIDDS